MKKSIMFKILTLFLTVVVFSCCSGCFLYLIRKDNEEFHQHLVETQKQRKAQADALIPEIDGYIFEALPQAAFANQEDWESKGFLDYNAFRIPGLEYRYYCEITKNDEYYMFNVKLHYRRESSPEDVNIGKIVIGKQEYEERLLKLFELFTRHGGVVCYDNNFFMLVWMSVYSRYLEGPPALFLLDFENNTILYAGYAKGSLEYEIANGEFFIKEDMVYKLTKESE